MAPEPAPPARLVPERLPVATARAPAAPQGRHSVVPMTAMPATAPPALTSRHRPLGRVKYSSFGPVRNLIVMHASDKLKRSRNAGKDHGAAELGTKQPRQPPASGDRWRARLKRC